MHAWSYGLTSESIFGENGFIHSLDRIWCTFAIYNHITHTYNVITIYEIIQRAIYKRKPKIQCFFNKNEKER